MNLNDKIKTCDSIIKLMDLIESRYGNNWKDEFLHEGSLTLDNMQHCGVAYEPEVVVIPWEEVDRLSSMFAGPLFTSIKYPWPSDAKGRIALPIFQIHLKDLSNLSNDNFGNGVLQCWNFIDGYVLREIPQEDFKLNNLTPTPLFESVSVVEDWGMYWLRDGVSKIIGYGKPFFSCAYTDINIKDDAPLEVREIESYLKMLDCDVRSTQIFGTFDLIQYDHDEVGEKMLISISDGINGVTGFGVEGTAQVFYKKGNNGVVNYFLEWSC